MSEFQEHTTASEGAEISRAPRRMPVWLEMTLTVLVAAVIALSVRMFVFEITRVDGPSMLPTLHTDEQILVNKLAYVLGSGPARMDIVICNFPGSSAHFVKRVIGLSGETVAVEDGRVYIDGEPLQNDQNAEPMLDSMDPVRVPAGYVFVMGDNRNDSMDSRQVGAIPIKDIIGRATAVVWPLDELEWL